VAGCEIGRDRDIEQPALPARRDIGHPGDLDRFRRALRQHLEMARFLGDQCSAVWKESQCQRRLERGKLAERERLAARGLGGGARALIARG